MVVFAATFFRLGAAVSLGGFVPRPALGLTATGFPGRPTGGIGPAAAFLTPAPAASPSAAELRRDAGQRSDPERYLPERYLPERALRD